MVCLPSFLYTFSFVSFLFSRYSWNSEDKSKKQDGFSLSLENTKNKNQCSLVVESYFFSLDVAVVVVVVVVMYVYVFVCTLLQSFSRCSRSIRDFLFILSIVFDAFFRSFLGFIFFCCAVYSCCLVGYFLVYFFLLLLCSFPGWSCCC